MALGVVKVTARTHGSPAAVTEDIASLVQDGDMVWVVAQANNVSTTTVTISGSGWTLRFPFQSFFNGSNTRWHLGWSRRWTTGDPTSWTVTTVSNPQDVTVSVFIIRSDYDTDSSHWTVVANTPQQWSTAPAGQSMNQLTPTSTSNDLRLIWMNGPTSGIGCQFASPLPCEGGVGALWGGMFSAGGMADLGSGNDNEELVVGRGKLPVDSANANIITHPNSQTVIAAAFSIYDGDTTAYADGFTLFGPNKTTSPREISAEVDIEGMDAGSPAGLTSAGGRFEGGSHIY